MPPYREIGIRAPCPSDAEKQKLNCTLLVKIPCLSPGSFRFRGLGWHAIVHRSERFSHRPIEHLHDHVLASASVQLLLRKEVIQPQVPLRLPCYDFIPVTAHSVGRCLLAVSLRTSATNNFHDVTGGVYKARERIHGAVADAPLLAIPASWRRVAASNPNWARFS